MEQNVGFEDRLARFALGVVLVCAYLMGWLRGKAGLLLLVAGMLLSSAASGYCLLYEQLGMSTRKPAKGH